MKKRNLIYTGLTRAKQALFILGNPQAFLYGIKNISDSKRKTTLVSKINQNKNVETYEESSYNQELIYRITCTGFVFIGCIYQLSSNFLCQNFTLSGGHVSNLPGRE